MDNVRCNQCYSIFTEEEIVINDEQESCPKCGECGFIMDIELNG